MVEQAQQCVEMADSSIARSAVLPLPATTLPLKAIENRHDRMSHACRTQHPKGIAMVLTPHQDAQMEPSKWVEGVSDAIGFLVGALTGFGIGRALGFDMLAPGYDSASIIGIALVGVGGGAGLQLARAWRARRRE
jgi:hypothetical protein